MRVLVGSTNQTMDYDNKLNHIFIIDGKARDEIGEVLETWIDV